MTAASSLTRHISDIAICWDGGRSSLLTIPSLLRQAYRSVQASCKEVSRSWILLYGRLYSRDHGLQTRSVSIHVFTRNANPPSKASHHVPRSRLAFPRCCLGSIFLAKFVRLAPNSSKHLRPDMSPSVRPSVYARLSAYIIAHLVFSPFLHFPSFHL